MMKKKELGLMYRKKQGLIFVNLFPKKQKGFINL